MTWFWVYIIIFSLFTGLIFGIGGFLISHWWFKPKNNPRKAFIFVPMVDKPYKGKLLSSSSEGSVFTYDNNTKTILVPHAYRIVYHWYRRILYLDSNNNLIATPQVGDKRLSKNEKDNLIHELVTSKIGADAIKQIKGKQNTLMVIIAIAIIVAIIAGVAGYALHKPKVTTNIPKIEQQVPAPKVQIEGSGQTK